VIGIILELSGIGYRSGLLPPIAVMLRSDFSIKAVWTAWLISWIYSPVWVRSDSQPPDIYRRSKPASPNLVENMEITLDDARNPTTAEIKFAALGK
jgi:hypothetical protein